MQSVYTFSLASPTMTHQPIKEAGENEDFFGFPLSGRKLESREVGRDATGWLGDELMVTV